MGHDGIVVRTTGEVVGGAGEYVRRQLAAFVEKVPESVRAVRLRLTVFGRSNAPWASLVQVNLDARGHLVRVQIPAAFVREAGRQLKARLAAQLVRLERPDQARSWPAGKRPGPQPARRNAEIVRHKTYVLSTCTPDEAALTMDLMDYDFHVFVDAETGQDSVVHRVGPTGYRLARLAGMAPPSAPTVVPLTLNVHPVPRLTADQAVERLTATELPYRFFQNEATGRGAVLYRRYDGHYGLITPSVLSGQDTPTEEER